MTANDANAREFELPSGLPTMMEPARYRIRLRGRLAPDDAGRLSGLAITSAQGEGEDAATTLEGVLVDQAALAGVLRTLYSYHLPILSVECLGSAEQS